MDHGTALRGVWIILRPNDTPQIIVRDLKYSDSDVGIKRKEYSEKIELTLE